MALTQEQRIKYEALFQKYPVAISHMHQQFTANQLGLVLGAGIGQEIGFPDWKELVRNIADNNAVDGSALFNDSVKRTVTSQMLFQLFKQKYLSTGNGQNTYSRYGGIIVLSENEKNNGTVKCGKGANGKSVCDYAVNNQSISGSVNGKIINNSGNANITLNHHRREIIRDIPQEIENKLNPKNSAIVFIAYNCVLTERQTEGGAYVYTAINIKTGKAIILGRRNNQLEEIAYPFMAEKIYETNIRGDSRFSCEKNPGESTRGYVLNKAAANIFSEILPRYGYAIRGNQIELAEHILNIIERRGITLAESEVGTGKTHAYLIAALLAKRGRLNDLWLRGYYRDQSWAESAYMPVVVSTSSIALQNAIVKDYIPELSNILMQNGVIKRPLEAVVRKGREHYICEKRLETFYVFTDKQTRVKLKPFMDDYNAPFDLTDIDSLTPYMKRHICVSDKCGEMCGYKGRCRYHNYIKKANSQTVDFQITNHNYFLADIKHRASGKKPLLPHYQLVIIDEAHKFLSAARSMYGLELTDTEIPELVQEIHALANNKSFNVKYINSISFSVKSFNNNALNSKSLNGANVLNGKSSNGANAYINNKSLNGVNVHKLAKTLKDQSEKLFKQLKDGIFEFDNDNGEYDEAERFPVQIDSGVCRHLKSIACTAASIVTVITNTCVSELHKERRDKVIWRLNMLSERAIDLMKQSKHIYWLEDCSETAFIHKSANRENKTANKEGKAVNRDSEAENSALCAIPKDLNERLHNDLWKKDIPVVLTSGTLSAAGDFTRTKETLGLDRLPDYKMFSVTMPSPFDYKQNSLLYISNNVPFPNGKDKRYISAVANEIERLILATYGHAAVLFTSYNVMSRVHAILKKRNLPYPLFRLERGGVQAIEQFKKSGNGILLASGALWEGIDIPGDTLSLLIIVKLPFAVPDPIGDYEKSLCGSMQVYKNRCVVPDMLVKNKQGFGRAIRTESDTAVIAFLDCRVREGAPYRKRALSSLPRCRVTSKISDVRRFIRNKKPRSYFKRD